MSCLFLISFLHLAFLILTNTVHIFYYAVLQGFQCILSRDTWRMWTMSSLIGTVQRSSRDPSTSSWVFGIYEVESSLNSCQVTRQKWWSVPLISWVTKWLPVRVTRTSMFGTYVKPVSPWLLSLIIRMR